MVGQQIDNYRVIEKIGSGGMATVYLAEDIGLRRQVVLKIMLPHLAQNEAFLTRFQREARTTARLNHPNIIQIYTSGVTSYNRSYRAMQYVSVGFALNVSDNDGPGTTVQEIMKSSSQSRSFTHPDSWGTLTLQE